MELLKTIEGMRNWRRDAGSVALVPTMGALHEGHLRHLEIAREHADHVVVSIFVNPTQFGPGEDFHRYPRTLESDLAQCEAAGAGVGAGAVFAPAADEMYPPGSADSPCLIDVPGLTATLEGEHRPGHFRGVCRVVMKLLQIVQPEVATFGEKDFQQLRVIEAMTADTAVPVEIVRVATLRESDGLAKSSRNAYLRGDERERATALARTLLSARAMVEREGGVGADELEATMRQTLEAAGLAVDYAAVRDAALLRPMARVEMNGRPARGLIAARLGDVRLIDNMALNLGDSPVPPSM